LQTSREHLSKWWLEAREDFSELANAQENEKPITGKKRVSESVGAYLTLKSKKLPKVRRTLIESLKSQIAPLKVLDDFQAAGVFVNWWDGIKYDLKTILTNGWSATLIPEAYMIGKYFRAEADELERIENGISAAETALEEATETAQETLEYELDEEEKLTPALMKDKLKDAIKESADKKEAALYEAALQVITDAEKARKDGKKKLDEKRFDLEIKILLKKFGAEDETLESRRLLAQAEKELSDQEKVKKPENEKMHKKKIATLKSDIKTLTERIDAIQRLANSVGGVITEEDAKELILKKHHDWVTEQLERYLGSESRFLTQSFEILWQKYSIPLNTIENYLKEDTLLLTTYLKKLGYNPE